MIVDESMKESADLEADVTGTTSPDLLHLELYAGTNAPDLILVYGDGSRSEETLHLD